jgi:hypothetical protein
VESRISPGPNLQPAGQLVSFFPSSGEADNGCPQIKHFEQIAHAKWMWGASRILEEARSARGFIARLGRPQQ